MGYLKIWFIKLPVPLNIGKDKIVSPTESTFFSHPISSIPTGRTVTANKVSSTKNLPPITQPQSPLSEIKDLTYLPPKHAAQIIAFTPPPQVKWFKASTIKTEQKKSKSPPKQEEGTTIFQDTIQGIRKFAQTDQPTELAKKLLVVLLIIGILVPLLGVSFIFVALFMPSLLVGTTTTELVPITQNTTLSGTSSGTSQVILPPTYQQPPTTISIPPKQETPPSPPKQVVINIPKPPSPTPPSQPIQTPTPPSPPKVTPPQNSDLYNGTPDVTGIPAYLMKYIKYNCYWNLRNKGYGHDLDPEEECNSQSTGLWIDACNCCHTVTGNCDAINQ